MREVAINAAYHTRASEQRQRRHSPATPRYLSNTASRGCHAMKISTDVTGHKVSQRRQRQTDRQTDDKWMCMWSAVTRWSVWRHRRTQLRCNYSSLCPLDDKTTAITSLARSRRAPQHQPCRLLNFTSLWHVWLHGFTGLFTDTSEHIRLLLFSFFPTFLFLVLCSRYSLTYVSFLAHVKIACGIV